MNKNCKEGRQQPGYRKGDYWVLGYQPAYQPAGEVVVVKVDREGEKSKWTDEERSRNRQ